jgi:hypothetical protein
MITINPDTVVLKPHKKSITSLISKYGTNYYNSYEAKLNRNIAKKEFDNKRNDIIQMFEDEGIYISCNTLMIASWDYSEKSRQEFREIYNNNLLIPSYKQNNNYDIYKSKNNYKISYKKSKNTRLVIDFDLPKYTKDYKKLNNNFKQSKINEDLFNQYYEEDDKYNINNNYNQSNLNNDFEGNLEDFDNYNEFEEYEDYDDFEENQDYQTPSSQEDTV